MGFTTNITISNDFFDWVQKNPETFVRAIGSGMNGGTNSMATKARLKDPYRGTEYPTEEEREADRHYVTIHPAQHADVPQVIYTYRNSSYSLWDVQMGIEEGYLDLVSNPEMHIIILREMTREIRRRATAVNKALNDYEKRKENHEGLDDLDPE